MCNQSGAPRELVSMKFDRWELDLINFKSIVSDYESIHFDDKDDVEQIYRIWKYVLPDSVFDVGRWNLLTSLRITVTIGNKPYEPPLHNMAIYFETDRLDYIT